MFRPTMYVAAWMILGFAAPAFAQECTDTFDATAVGLGGTFEATFTFEPSDSTTGVQTGSLLITGAGEATPTLTDLEGIWLAANRCQFSIWNVSQTSVDGIARGSGITIGDQLIGVLQVRRFEGSANGVFIVTGEGAEVVPEEPTEPPPTETTALSPTPATRQAR